MIYNRRHRREVKVRLNIKLVRSTRSGIDLVRMPLRRTQQDFRHFVIVDLFYAVAHGGMCLCWFQQLSAFAKGVKLPLPRMVNIAKQPNACSAAGSLTPRKVSCTCLTEA